MARAFTQQEYASLEARKKHITTISGILTLIVPVEVLFLFFVFAYLLELGTAMGLIVAVVMSSIVVLPLFTFYRLKIKVDEDLYEQTVEECEGIVDKIRYGSQVQFAGMIIDGNKFRVPHEIARNLRKRMRVRATYAQNSRIVLSVSPLD